MTALKIRSAPRRIKGIGPMEKRQKGICLVILSGVVFGLNPFFAKQVYANGGNAWMLTFFSKAVGAAALLGMGRLSREAPVPLDRRRYGQLLICSLGAAAAPILLYSSYHSISSGMATTLHFCYPALVLLGCAVFWRERLTRRQVVCCGLCMAGILCFYHPAGDSSPAGILLALISGAAYAFYVAYLSKSGLQELPSYQLAGWLCLLTALETLAASAAAGQIDLVLTPAGWAFALAFSVLNSCVATIAFQIGARYVGPQSASLLSTFEPLTSVLVGTVFFREPFSPRDCGGMICILLSVVLLARPEKHNT